MPEIAIITPMYNAASTLAETVASGKSQSFQDWEWYLMDDGSSDNSLDLARKLAEGDSRIKVVENGRVGHIGILRNRAVRETAAEFLTFLDADDVWDPEFLAKQWKLIKESKASVVHSAAWHLVDGKSIEVPYRYAGSLICDPPDMLSNLRIRNPVYSPSVMIRRDVFVDAGYFSEHPDHFSILDGDMWLKLAPRHRFAYNAERLVHYRVSSQSLSGSSKNIFRNSRGELAALENAIERESSKLSEDFLKVLRFRLGRAQASHGRLLLEQEQLDLAASRGYYKLARKNGYWSASSTLFGLAGLFGKRPPYWLHKALLFRYRRG